MKKVAIFRSDLLRPTETFIREQALALRQWQPILLGYRRVAGSLSLERLQARILPGPGPAMLPRLVRTLCHRLALPYPPRITTLRKLGCSLVHAHFGTEAVEIWPVAKALRLPMLVTLHGYDINIDRSWWEAGYGGPRTQHYPRRLLALARNSRVQFVAVSKAIRTRATTFGIPEDKIVVRHIGIDVEKYRPGGLPISERHKRILFVGRLVENKGVDYLIRAFAEVRGRVPEAELVIVGEGPLHEDLQRLATKCGVRVQFLGAQSPEQVKHQLDQAQVLCLPSVTVANGASEGFGMVLLEAQACGVPVVTSSKGGRSEALVESETGFAFAERDIPGLAAHLAFLLENSGVLTRMSQAAVAFVRHEFDIRKCTERMEELYDALGPRDR